MKPDVWNLLILQLDLFLFAKMFNSSLNFRRDVSLMWWVRWFLLFWALLEVVWNCWKLFSWLCLDLWVALCRWSGICHKLCNQRFWICCKICLEFLPGASFVRRHFCFGIISIRWRRVRSHTRLSYELEVQAYIMMLAHLFLSTCQMCTRAILIDHELD